MARVRLACTGLWHWSLSRNVVSTRSVALASLGVAALMVLVILVNTKHVVKGHKSATFTKSLSGYVADPKSWHYGVVLDCGSSGTRVYVYYWPMHSGNSKELLQIQQLMKDNQAISMKISPGLSTFGTNPDHASNYLEPLLTYAADNVPKSKHQETPLYILATAGMRMLPKRERNAILDDIKTDIPRLFDFVFSDTHVEVITGKEEGVYAWISMNFVLGRFDHATLDTKLVSVEASSRSNEAPHYRKRTVGIIDMGGGSAQIAYEITKPDSLPKSVMAEFNLGCLDSDKQHTYRVYVTTFLGYGANAARKRYSKKLIENSELPRKNITRQRSVIGSSPTHPVLDPCLPVDLQETFTLNSTQYHIKGVGDFKTCERNLKSLLNQTVPCQKDPCSMNGVYQPKINFFNSEFYGFSEYWYSMEDVLRMGGTYDSARFEKSASEFCLTKWPTLYERFQKKLYPKADEDRFRTQCFKSAWVATALHDGFRFPKSYKNFQSAQFVNGKDVQWTLGALLYRSRHLPLREVEKNRILHAGRPPWIKQPMVYPKYVMVVCIVLMVTVILIYVGRLRRTKGGSSAMKRVPSYSYSMIEQGQAQSGINVEIMS